jgi:hypothetical protein
LVVLAHNFYPIDDIPLVIEFISSKIQGIAVADGYVYGVSIYLNDAVVAVAENGEI